jgi:fatty acid desaturase
VTQPVTPETEPAFTPEEEAHWERRKAESEKPIMERIPPQWRTPFCWIAAIIGALVATAIGVGAFYLMG